MQKMERNVKGFETTEPLKVHGDAKKREGRKNYVNAFAFSQIIQVLGEQTQENSN